LLFDRLPYLLVLQPVLFKSMGMNKAFWFIIIIAVSFAVVSCFSPVGHTHDNNFNSDFDDFWTVPQRHYYTLGDSFVRAKDLRAFVSSNGIVESISADNVEISLVKNPSAETPDEPIPIINGQYRLISSVVGTGSKLVIVAYGGKTDEYWIEIRNPDGGIDPLDTSEGEGSGIGTVWK